MIRIEGGASELVSLLRGILGLHPTSAQDPHGGVTPAAPQSETTQQEAPVVAALPDPATLAALTQAPAPPGITNNPKATPAESFWGGGLPTGSGAETDEVAAPMAAPMDPKKDHRYELVQNGGIAWYHLVSMWSTNFGTEGPQPDRGTALIELMTDEGVGIYAYLRREGGLTQAVRSVSPQLGTKQSRLIAENIAQVSSAMGISGLADLLEYTRQFRKLED